MQKEIVVLLAKYNKAVNTTMNEYINTLSAEEWERPLGGYFSNIRGICSHIYLCDFNWLKRFSALREFPALKTPLFHREPYAFTEQLFEDKEEYLAKRPELDNAISDFIDEVEDRDLQSALKYTDYSGRGHEKNFGGLILQCFNHETHNRGIVSLYLELLGRDNDFSSLGKVL